MRYELFIAVIASYVSIAIATFIALVIVTKAIDDVHNVKGVSTSFMLAIIWPITLCVPIIEKIYYSKRIW